MKGPTAALSLSLLLLPGCLTSTQAGRLQTDLDEVKRQIFQVQQETAGSRSRLEEIDRRLASGGGSAAAQADLQATMQSLLDQMQALNEQLQEVRARMAALFQEMQALREGGRRGSPPGAGAPSSAPQGPAQAAPPAGAAGSQADQTFKAAYADYSKGNYELALMGFSEFLRSNLDHPLAAEAQYWVGECLFSQGKFKEAAEAFDRAAGRYPGSDKVPAALLKKGFALMEVGQTAQAVATLQGLIESAPRSDEARLAAERLKQLGLRSR